MSDQPEALFLADVIENDPQSKAHHDAAAACLRRLHALVMDKQGEIYGLTFARETERKIHGLVKAECEALRQIVADYPPIEAELREVADSLFRAEAERDALRAENDALKKQPARFSLLRKPVKHISELGPCHCPPDVCSAPVIMGVQTPCLRHAALKEVDRE